MTSNSSILVTGGAGYVGSHTVVELLAAGHDVVIADNLCNSRAGVIDRIETIAGRRPEFAEVDMRDRYGLRELFSRRAFDAVLHFAGLKSVGESVAKPLLYYDNNVVGTVLLVEAMQEADVKTLVFSSSATVYGDPATVPIAEGFPLRPASPYGRSKVMVEDVLIDTATSDPGWRVALLRYFNPVGAHESGLIGEDPRGMPNNLMPHIARVAAGMVPKVSIFGADYPTPDGTAIRDYIHVVDLAQGHLAALRALAARAKPLIVNLGTGKGHSVLEMIEAYARAAGRHLEYQIVGRRPGDVPAYYADPSLAYEIMGWRATRNVEQMCADAWRWQTTMLAVE